jgi:hypothetical protein
MVDGYDRGDQATAVKWDKKIPTNDKATDVMIEVCSVYAAHMYDKHGEITDFDSVDAALQYVIDRNTESESASGQPL